MIVPNLHASYTKCILKATCYVASLQFTLWYDVDICQKNIIKHYYFLSFEWRFEFFIAFFRCSVSNTAGWLRTAGQKRGEFGSGHVKNNLQPDLYLSRFLTPPLNSRCLPSLFAYSINLFISICFTNTTHLFFLFLAHLQKRREILKIGVIWFQNKKQRLHQ